MRAIAFLHGRLQREASILRDGFSHRACCPLIFMGVAASPHGFQISLSDLKPSGTGCIGRNNKPE